MRGGVLLPAFAAAALLCVPPASACPGEGASSGIVASVSREAEVTLRDGIVLRPAWVAVSPPPDGTDADVHFAVPVGSLVRYRTLMAEPDRWGRIVAQMFVFTEGQEAPGRWLEADLAGAGRAVVRPEPQGRDCAGALLARERGARAAARGVWARGGIRVHRADDVAEIAAEAGRHAIVEGRVLSVGERASRTYLNFGRRWSEDFTVTVPKRLWETMGPGAAWRGRHVRVRGVIDMAGGPLIAVTMAEQIEILSGSAAE